MTTFTPGANGQRLQNNSADAPKANIPDRILVTQWHPLMLDTARSEEALLSTAHVKLR